VFKIQAADSLIPVYLGAERFQARVARTIDQQRRGLMNEAYLPKDAAMLFVFHNVGRHPFWMKNTLIPLDIIWINKNKKIVYIKEDFLPCRSEQCPDENPDVDALYVLEVNAGTAKKLKIQIGDKVDFL